jgi:hypothetical protein
MANLYAVIALSPSLLRGFQLMYCITKVMEIGKGWPLPSIEEVLVEEVQQDIDVASDVVEVGIVTEHHVNDVSSDVIEEEPAAPDVEDGIGATEPNMTLPSVRSRARNLKLGEKVAILKYWDELKSERSGTKGKLVKWAQKTFHRQSFQKKDLNRLIDNAAKLREQYTTHSGQRQALSNVCDREGKYPEMEERLAIRIRLLRKCGLIFETWMLAVEGMSCSQRKQ